MDKHERELFRKAKEQKRLLREQRRKAKEEQISKEKCLNLKEFIEEKDLSEDFKQRTENYIETSANVQVKHETQSTNERPLFLNIKKNCEEKGESSQESEMNGAIFQRHKREPEAPLHRNKRQNVNQCFTDYVEEHKEKENVIEEEPSHLEETERKSFNLLEKPRDEEMEEIVESYEIIEESLEDVDQDYMKFKEKLQNKPNLHNKNFTEIRTIEPSEVNATENLNQTQKEQESILNLIDNELHEYQFYNPVESAQYEELDYLHKILLEKKKELLGNSYDEEKEQQEEELLDALDNIHEFHKRKNRRNSNEEEEENDSPFRIEDIYAFLNMERDIFLSKEKKDSKQDRDLAKNTNENIPKGFFDDQEKDILVRNKISLTSLNHNIAMIKKEKKKILSMYTNIDHLEHNRVSKFIDFLYDDNEYENEDIMKNIEMIKKKERKKNSSSTLENDINNSSKICEPTNKQRTTKCTAEKKRIELLKKKFFEKTGSEYIPEWMKPPTLKW